MPPKKATKETSTSSTKKTYTKGGTVLASQKQFKLLSSHKKTLTSPSIILKN